LVIDKQFKNAIFDICESQNISSWVIGKTVAKDNSKENKFLPEIIT